MTELTLIVPCYNEALVIASSLGRVCAVLGQVTQHFEVIVVDDASEDGTEREAQAVGEHDARIRVVSLLKRVGKGASLAAGLAAAQADVVGYIDTDLEAGLSEMVEMIGRVQAGADLVCLRRRYSVTFITHHPLRYAAHVLSVLWYRLLFTSAVHDPGSGTKWLRRSRVRSLLPNITDQHWLWETELVVWAERAGLRVEECVGSNMPVRRASHVQLWRDGWTQLRGLWRLRWSA